ncbi:MAG TPA: VCBS repeat-containing protein [Kofleriaceae bacterium]|nr:VCBS repeat-containing protein [Kofleriaceae bacterium]
MRTRGARAIAIAALVAPLAISCSGSGEDGGGGGDDGGDGGGDDDGGDGGHPIMPPAPVCDGAGGPADAATPELSFTLSDRGDESWLASPVVADLDGDGEPEIAAGRDERMIVWRAGGEVAWSAGTDGRIWSSPVAADLDPDRDGLELAAASRGRIYAWDASGEPLDGFPFEWRDEMRSLAAGDIDGDGRLELVAVTTNPLDAGDQRDIVIAVEPTTGEIVDGFPANTTGRSGCDDACYVTGGYDQNLALGDVDGDGRADILAPQDNAYMSLHDGTGRAFDAAPIFEGKTKFMGIRFLHDYALARQGWADDEETADQAHFTNSAPAIADMDGDGVGDLVVLGSVQNAAQTDRERGVALWVVHNDGTRPPGWETPVHFPDYLGGLWDFEDTNVVAATNQVAVVDLDPDRAGPEAVFAGFDGRVHAVSAAGEDLWSATFATDGDVLTGGVAVADLSADGVPEVVFATYSPDDDRGALFVLDGGGNQVARLPLPGRGAMAVPTIADADGDGQLDIAVSLKDADDGDGGEVMVFTVPGSGTGCLLWPTGRGNDRRDGYLPVE